MAKTTFKYWLIVLAVAAASCTDLKEEAYDVLPSDIYFQDRNSIIAAVTRVYEHGHWVGWDGDRWLLSELTADNFVWTQKGRHGYDDGQWIRLHTHTWNAEQNQIYGSWVGPYQGIMQTIVIGNDIEKLDYPRLGMTEADKKQHLAEFKVLRAWFYLFLIDYFRNVPIQQEAGVEVGQSSPTEVAAYIESELKSALPDLPKNTRGGQMGSGAAALLMRLYLNHEKWTGVPKYTECATIAQEIIDGVYGTYSIDPDYRGPFRSGVGGYRSSENIFEFPHAKNIYEWGWMYNAMMHYQMRFSLDNDWGGWNGIHLTPSLDPDGNPYPFLLGKPFSQFSADDYRKQPFRTINAQGDYEGFFLVGQQYQFDAARGYGYDSTKPILAVEEYNNQPLRFVDQVARFSEKPGGRWTEGSRVSTGEENSGIRFIKFPWLPLSKNLFHFQSAPEIRLSEVYYALAECRYRAGDQAGAAVLLDAVRKRNFPDDKWASHSYVANPSKLTDDEFIIELGREFLGERHRRTDLVRWNRFGDAWWDKPQDAADKSVFPIPLRALNTNPLLKPNGFE